VPLYNFFGSKAK